MPDTALQELIAGARHRLDEAARLGAAQSALADAAPAMLAALKEARTKMLANGWVRDNALIGQIDAAISAATPKD
jgi:hypothetical protein